MAVSLRPLRSSDTAVVLDLWADRFGTEADTARAWLDAALNPEHTARGHVAANPSHGPAAILGFGLLDMAGPGYTRDYLGLPSLDADVPLADRNGIFHMYCVRARHERQGVGTALFDRHLAVCRTEGVGRAVGIAWHRRRHRDSRDLFEAAGFQRMGTFERFYARAHPRPRCPDCGGFCTCTASLYARGFASA
jgi:GNAT superfamily N-acetyltransferase